MVTIVMSMPSTLAHSVLACVPRRVLVITAASLAAACSDPGASYVHVSNGHGGAAVRVADTEWIMGPSGTYIAVPPGTVDAYCKAIQGIASKVQSALAAGEDPHEIYYLAVGKRGVAWIAFSNSLLGTVTDPSDAEEVRAFLEGSAIDRPRPCDGPIDEWGADLFDGTDAAGSWRVFFGDWGQL